MKVTSTKVADPLVVQHTRVHLRENRKRPKERGKVPHQLREGGEHRGNGNSEASACYTTFNFVKDYDHRDGTVKRANICRAHSDPSNLGGDSREDVPGCAVYEKNDTFSPCVAQDDVSTFEATRPDALAPFWRQKGKSKGKGKFLVRPSCLSLENRNVCGRKGRWAYDREHTMSPSCLSPKPSTRAARTRTRLHLSSQPEKVATCFVLNDCSDDYGILPKSTGQTFPTSTDSTASTAVDTRTKRRRAMVNRDRLQVRLGHKIQK